MVQRNELQNGLRLQPRMLFGVTPLPSRELDEKARRLIGIDTLNVTKALRALTLSVRLAQNGGLPDADLNGTFLFYGPTGCGKSTQAALLPQLWATHNGCAGTLVRVRTHDVPSGEHGGSQKNVVRLFEELAELCGHGGPVFVVIDEIETLMTDREKISTKTSPIDARASVNAFLEQIDRKAPTCMLIGTTNAEGQLDRAALNRIDFLFHVGHPDARTRLRALSAAIAAVNPQSPVLQRVAKAALEQLSKETEGLSFRQLRRIPILCLVLFGVDTVITVRELIAAARYLQQHSSCTKGELV